VVVTLELAWWLDHRESERPRDINRRIVNPPPTLRSQGTLDLNPVRKITSFRTSGETPMFESSKRMAELVNQFSDGFFEIDRRFKDLCPEADKIKAPNEWEPGKRPFLVWAKKHGAFYDAKELRFLWYDLFGEMLYVLGAICEITAALERRNGANGKSGKTS
jgi:hypothetical protein